MSQQIHDELVRRVAYLEFANDQLQTELDYVDQLLRTIGFPEGLETIKTAARELLNQENDETENDAQ